MTSGDKILTKYDLTLHVYDAYFLIVIVRYWMEVEYSSTSTESSLYLGEFASVYFNLRCMEKNFHKIYTLKKNSYNFGNVLFIMIFFILTWKAMLKNYLIQKRKRFNIIYSKYLIKIE